MALLEHTCSTRVDDTPFDYAPRIVLGARSLAMLSAALRHVRDAEHLVSADPSVQSPDQAFHLAALGPQCARKAARAKATFDEAIGHGVAGTSELALRFAVVADPVARRYDIQGWSGRYPALLR